jgi:hypothetical protein
VARSSLLLLLALLFRSFLSAQATNVNVNAGLAPLLTSLSPNTGSIGQSVVLAGNSFGATQGTSTLTVSGITAAVTAWSDTSVTFVIPTTATGAVVMTRNGRTSNSLTLTVIAGAACTTTTANTTQATIQAAVTAAASGAVICVPAGSSTWAAAVTISSKALTLKGNGIGSTNITINAGAGAGLLVQGVSAANFVRITGFTFINLSTPTDGIVQIYGATTSGATDVGFRFDHNRLSLSGGRGMSVGYAYGLIDHDTFNATASVQSLSPYGSNIGNDGGYTPWSVATTMGTVNAIYVEDNTFDYGADYGEDSIDGYTGLRLVIRHNTFHNTHHGVHGTDSGGNRSAATVEVYSNTYTNDTAGHYRGTTMRGGTGVYFDNTYGGTFGNWDPYALYVYRATITGPYSWSYCTGTQWDIGSTDLSSNGSRANVTYGTVARFSALHPDTICTGSTGGDCSRPFDGPGTGGYPCRDQPGRGHDQVLMPVYAWNNTGTNHPVLFADDGGCAQCGGGTTMATWLLENRDYYNSTATFNGTVGVGRGVNASKPATCTTGVAYFATDIGTTGTLYQCSATNTWTAYYTSYVYPHPLSTP